MTKVLLPALLASAMLSGSVQSGEPATNPPTESGLKIVALQPGQPELVPYDGGTARFLVSSEDTNGAWSLVELAEKPGYKTRIHRHHYTDETYYVLQGVLTAKVGDRTHHLPAGSYITIPHGTPHAQGNLGKVPVRVLLTMTPGGFEKSFKARAELIKTANPDDPDFRKKREAMMVKEKYDREFIEDWNPEISPNE